MARRKSDIARAFEFGIREGIKAYQYGKKTYKSQKEKGKAKRLERAHIARSIVRSNLPEAVKQRELTKLRQAGVQKGFREKFRKSRLPSLPRFIRHKKENRPKAFFGTESERQ